MSEKDYLKCGISIDRSKMHFMSAKVAAYRTDFALAVVSKCFSYYLKHVYGIWYTYVPNTNKGFFQLYSNNDNNLFYQKSETNSLLKIHIGFTDRFVINSIIVTKFASLIELPLILLH